MKSSFPISGLVAFFALSLLSGCAYFVRKDCQSTDWRHAGYEEGSLGGKREKFLQHQRRCAEAEAMIPESEWNAGFAEGHAAYCSEGGGRTAGLAGKGYTGVCKGEGERAFERGYQAGLEVYCPRAGLEEGENGDKYEAGVCGQGHLETLYRTAYRQGLRHYCQPSEGWRRGRAGRGYKNVCPGDLEWQFLEFYRAGEKAYGLEKRIQEKQKTRDWYEDQMHKKEEQGYDARWERENMRSAEREVQELTRQLTVIEARYLRF